MIRTASIAVFVLFMCVPVKAQRLHCVECFQRIVDGVKVMGNVSTDDIQALRRVLGDRLSPPNYIFLIIERSVAEHIKLSQPWFPFDDADADVSVDVRAGEPAQRGWLFLFRQGSEEWTLLRGYGVRWSNGGPANRPLLLTAPHPGGEQESLK